MSYAAAILAGMAVIALAAYWLAGSSVLDELAEFESVGATAVVMVIVLLAFVPESGGIPDFHQRSIVLLLLAWFAAAMPSTLLSHPVTARFSARTIRRAGLLLMTLLFVLSVGAAYVAVPLTSPGG